MALMFRCVCLAAVVTALAGCGTDEPLPAPPARPDQSVPDRPGPYAVGVTTTEIDDGSDAHRTLPIEIWYPASPARDAPTEVYELKAGSLVLAKLPSPMHAVRDAPALYGVGLRPVVVFSHGNGGTRLQSLFLTEHLASHGFIVAAPDHVGNTLAEMINGSALPALDAAKLRPGDVSRTLDAVIASNADARSPIYADADLARVGVVGHSFGAYTSLRIAGATVDPSLLDTECAGPDGGLICDGWSPGYVFPASQRDQRFAVAVAQAPGGSNVVGDGYEDIAIPTLIMDGTADKTTPWKTESLEPYEELRVPSELVIIDRAGHFTFSDMCELLDILSDAKSLFGNVFDDGCGPANIDPDEAHRIANGFTTAFLEHWLEGRDDVDSWLDATGTPPKDVAQWMSR